MGCGSCLRAAYVCEDGCKAATENRLSTKPLLMYDRESFFFFSLRCKYRDEDDIIYIVFERENRVPLERAYFHPKKNRAFCSTIESLGEENLEAVEES